MAGGFMGKVFSTPWLKKRDYDPEITSITDIELPYIYEYLDELITNIEIKTELKTYKSLGYRFKKENELNKLEYHSYQVGIILNAMKYELDLKITNNKDFFSLETLKHDKRTIESLVSTIIKKYDNNVDKSLSVIMLKKDMQFTPKDVGYLLYYLSFYQET